MPRPIDTETRLCAVIGNPVAHSLSPAMHNAAFSATDLNYIYVAFHVEDVAACLTGMRALHSFRGMSVTIPHKIAVMPYLDEIDPLAKDVGCVNTIVNEDGRLLGTTTDGLGTLKAFADADVSLSGANVLFLGAGGAVRSVAFAFARKAGVSRITILGRTREKVTALVEDLSSKSQTEIHAGDIRDDLFAAMESHEIIVQGTPVGMYPEPDASCVAPELLRPVHIVFDMVYRPLKTRLIRDAERAGCKTILGAEMLVNQAAVQFELWTGVSAPYKVMRDALLTELAKG